MPKAAPPISSQANSAIIEDPDRASGHLVGLVLHENKPMLKMCRKLGFSIAPEPNDATVLRVRKSLVPV